MVKAIVRFTELQLLEDLKQFPVAGIIGPRQVGKTTLARSLMGKLGKNCLYLDLELQEDIQKLENAEIYFRDHMDECIILDEIQTMPDLFPIIRGMVDKHRIPARFIILGSASPRLIRKSSESLAGRIAYTQLSPFNLTELDSGSNMAKHWFIGGFPDSYLAENEQSSRKWIRNFIQTYTDMDLPLLGMPGTPANIRKLLIMLANYQGGIWNASNFARSIGLSYVTMNRYIEFLEETFLIRCLQPYSSNIKKRLVKSPKTYIRDSGILHYLASVADFEQLQGNVLIGNSWEGYVIEQINHLLPPEIQMYYYRTHNGAEADLVLVEGLKPIAAIEIKYSSSPKMSKGFAVAIEDLNTNDNFIITPYSETYLKREDVRVCNLLDYVTNFIPGSTERTL